MPCGDFSNALYQYNKKLRDKLNGGYREVQMNYDDDGKDDKKEEEEKPAAKKNE